MANDSGDVGPLYTDGQKRLLGIIPLITAPLSIIGSALIIHIIFQERKKNLKQVYFRLMLGLSSADLLFSGGLLFFGPWMVPKGSEHSPGASGTVATCEVAGFFVNIVLASMVYTAGLAVYFSLSTRSNMRNPAIGRRVEPFIHGIAILLPLITGVYAVVMDYMNPMKVLPGYCWLEDLPSGCAANDAIECTRGADHKTFSRVAGAGTTLIVWLTIIVCMVLIYCKVRATELQLRQYMYTRGQNSSTLVRTKETGRTALAYILGFFICFFPLVTLELIDSPETEENRAIYFTFAFLAKFLNPLQGGVNAWIFLRLRPNSSPVIASIRRASKSLFKRSSTTLRSSNADIDETEREEDEEAAKAPCEDSAASNREDEEAGSNEEIIGDAAVM